MKAGQSRGHQVYSSAGHYCLVYRTTALNLNLLQFFQSLYSQFGKDSCWHQVHEGILRVPFPIKNCRIRSTSRATTKSITRTWAILNLNCREGKWKMVTFRNSISHYKLTRPKQYFVKYY